MNLTHVLTIAAAAAQLLNLFLTLRLRNAILESERGILKQVKCEYRESQVCEAKMDGMEKRVSRLESRPAGA